MDEQTNLTDTLLGEYHFSEGLRESFAIWTNRPTRVSLFLVILSLYAMQAFLFICFTHFYFHHCIFSKPIWLWFIPKILVYLITTKSTKSQPLQKGGGGRQCQTALCLYCKREFVSIFFTPTKLHHIEKCLK